MALANILPSKRPAFDRIQVFVYKCYSSGVNQQWQGAKMETPVYTSGKSMLSVFQPQTG